MRGINGVNDGQQVYSYDASFHGVNDDEIKGLFSYQHPALSPGVIMTEEVATTMPQSFTYRKIDDRRRAIALNTYLGRDYMGSAGRFGNHLSHVIVAEDEELTAYPCEFFGSPALRDHMEFEEVNNPNTPDFLPTPAADKGYIVDVDAVMDFLAEEPRLDIYKDMLYALLASFREHKRIVICDTPENIIMWIAALEYAFPLRSVRDINFTTYEFDPSLSSSHICGVVPEGTRYDNDSARLHFVFDFFKNEYPTFDKDEDFFEFIDTAFALSYDSLRDFHRFLTEGYSYAAADEEYYHAYTLYSLLIEGFAQYSYQKLNDALRFANDYATPSELRRVAAGLASQHDEMISAADDSFLCAAWFLFEHKDMMDAALLTQLRQTVVSRVLSAFACEEITENEFSEFFSKVERLFNDCGLSISRELMLEENRQQLFDVMRGSIALWKISFIVHVISTFAKETAKSANDLSIDSSIGQLYYGIMKSVYSSDRENGFYLVRQILDEYKGNIEYLLNMSLNIEGMLLDIADEKETDALWKHFAQLFVSMYAQSIENACRFFLVYKRYELVYMLYAESMRKAAGVSAPRSIFMLYFNRYISTDAEYRRLYLSKSIDMYYAALTKADPSEARQAKIELFDLVLKHKISVSFADQLVAELMRDVPLDRPSEENARFIKTAFNFTYNMSHQPVSGKLQLMLIGMVLESLKSRENLPGKITQLEQMAQGLPADLSRVRDDAVMAYMDWIMPIVCYFCQTQYDLASVYRLFKMSREGDRIFFTETSKHFLKGLKDRRSEDPLGEFLAFVFANAPHEGRIAVGKAMCKLNKQKIAELDELVANKYSSDQEIMKAWNEIKETASSTSPFLNDIGNFFRRRKGDR